MRIVYNFRFNFTLFYEDILICVDKQSHKLCKKIKGDVRRDDEWTANYTYTKVTRLSFVIYSAGDFGVHLACYLSCQYSIL